MEQAGGCIACSSCTGFKAVSKNGKFCSRCLHHLDKHYEGDKPALEVAPQRRASAASQAAIRDNDIKLFTDVDESRAEQERRIAKMTPPARRMSSNQNPLANRSPRKNADRSSPVLSQDTEVVQRSRPTPLVTGPSLKERIAMYSASAKMTPDTPQPSAPSSSARRGSLKHTNSFKLFSNGSSAPTPESSPRPPTGLTPNGTNTFSFFDSKLENLESGESLSSKSLATEKGVQSKPDTLIYSPEAIQMRCASMERTPGPPVVVISSPSLKRRGSLKERITIYNEAVQASSSPQKKSPSCALSDKALSSPVAGGKVEIPNTDVEPTTEQIKAQDTNQSENIIAQDTDHFVHDSSTEISSEYNTLSHVSNDCCLVELPY